MLFQVCALTWRAGCSQESWMVIRLLVHVTTGDSTFEQANFSMRPNLEFRVILQNPKKAKCSHKFDSFYSDYTKIYPLAGGLASTLHYKGILHKNEIISRDGAADLQELFNSHSSKVFYDVLFCKGGCIGGPGIASQAPLFMRKQRVLNYRRTANREKMDGKQGLDRYTKGIDFGRKF